MDFEKTYHLHPGMKLLRGALQKERNTKLIFALVLMVGGVTIPYVYFRTNSLAMVAGLIAILVGMRLMYEVIRTPKTADMRLLQLLKNNPRKIVWVYSVTTQTMPFGFHLWDTGVMYFKLLEGDELTVHLPVKKLKMVSKFLNRLLPHASFGYSDERMAQYELDPKLLLK